MMQIEFENVKNTLVIKISGDIDHHTCEVIRNKIDNEILSNNIKNLVIDMENVGFMDSSGIGVIIGRYKLISSNNGKVLMINMKPQIKRIYEICGLQRIIPFYPDLKQAMDSL